MSAGHSSNNQAMRDDPQQGTTLEESFIKNDHRKLPKKESGRVEFPLEGSLLVCSGKHDWMRAVAKDTDCRKKGTLYEFPLESSQTEDLEERVAKLEKEMTGIFPDLQTERSSAHVCIQTQNKKKDKAGRTRAVTGDSDCDLGVETHRVLYLPNDMDERLSLLEKVVFLRDEEEGTWKELVQVCAGDADGRMRRVGARKSRCQDTDRLSLLPVGIIDENLLEMRVTELEDAVWKTETPSATPSASPSTSFPSATPSPAPPSTSAPTSSPTLAPSLSLSPSTSQPTQVENLLIQVTLLTCPVGTTYVDDRGFNCDLDQIPIRLDCCGAQRDWYAP